MSSVKLLIRGAGALLLAFVKSLKMRAVGINEAYLQMLVSHWQSLLKFSVKVFTVHISHYSSLFFS